MIQYLFCSIIFFWEIPNFLTNEECDYLIKRAEKTGLTLSEVVVPTESHTDKDDFASKCIHAIHIWQW